ncbi:hypothetical protein LB526_16725 [Mesorhizobium sp. CA6]|uniref:hypothetical protein n=1 Tax=Mesorhizobium sp. CA6 TaxID=588500 RepID=UPI001CCBDED6|nr:hypothetical protein [Mesorhizobium sp. CA6]MBZ9768401.1 hypothetical protein [Mesorhizobium sp. CA6]
MKKCFLFIIDGFILGVPMVTTIAGWEMFVGPAIAVGELASTNDLEIGIAVGRIVELHTSNVLDEDVNPDLLIESVSKYGIKSYKALFRKCLQMSVVKELEDRYKLTPYARLKKGGEVGGEELDITLSSNGQSQDLGASVRKCVSYCR